MKRSRKFLLLICTLSVAFLVLTFFANRSVIETSESFVTDDINAIAPAKAGLLLGTSKNLKNGNRNDFFYHRIDAAVELFRKGKIRNIIVSGDNSREGYNEPLDMKSELTKRGVPDSVIFLDYAGFRTLDSVVRAKEIFGQKSVIIISQKFHNERAVFIARENDIAAFGFNAKEVESFKGFKTKLREFFARDKVFVDLLLGVEPRFLGEKVSID